MKTEQGALRILIATPRAFPFMGGVENHVYQIATRMAHAGLDITVVSGDTSRKLPASECVNGITMLRVPVWPREGDFYLSPDFYRIIQRGNAQGQPWDLVHIQNYLTFCAPVSMLGAKQARIPYIVTFHGGGHPSRLRNAMRNLQRVAMKPLLMGASRYVATARFEFAQFGDGLGLPKSRFVYIPNGSDIAMQQDGPKQPTTPGLILSIGRLESHKGHHRVIQAMPHILKTMPEARLRIVGNGPFEADLRSMVQQMNLSDYVEIGYFPPERRHELVDLLRHASLVTLLSEYETHPMALLEALAMGKSALVADTSGLSEIARDGLVRAIPLHHPADQTATAIVDQLRNPIQPKPVKLPTWDDCTTSLIDLYHEVLARPKPIRTVPIQVPVSHSESATNTRERVLV